MGLVQLIIILVVLGACWYLVTKHIPMPDAVKTVITIIAVLALVVILLQMIGVETGLNIGSIQ